MNRMKLARLLAPLALATAAIFASHNTDAALLRSEEIVGYSTGTLGTDATRGTLNGWDAGLNTPFINLTNGSGSLDGTGLGLVASAGDRVFLAYYNVATNALAGARNQFATNTTFPQTVETNLYFSFLYKFLNAATVSSSGQYIAQVFRANSGTGTPQHWAVQAINVAGQIQLGISKAGAPNNATNYATTNINIGDTVFIVVRQHIIPAAQNDVYDLWINPPPESFGTNETDIPPSAANVGSLTTDGTEDSSGTGPGRLVFFAGPNAQLDEIRIATTWAEATPFFGQCLPAGVGFTSATSVTNSAEISSTFSVAATGTSPTVQWQRSTNGGTAFFDLVGATAATYSTPALQISENLSKYRAIVSVACNGSSITSAVATVTLTNPIVTPVGLIMDDHFIDPDLGFNSRNNLPLSVTNSLWFTDNDESQPTTPGLYAFGEPGDLHGIPKSGGSSLWLGYFVETNSVLHLGIGRQIKVTFPFTATGYTSFTNYSAVRFGLFDYYDAGTRIVADGPTVGGSRGNGNGVRGYILSQNFGPTFNANSPMQLQGRNFLFDDNLMGSAGDYFSFGSGPAGGGFSNSVAFVAGTQYTLEFTVTRTDVNTITLAASISGNGTNWTHSITDTNLAYHRFDSFAIRPNSLETSADSFIFPEFKVEVLAVNLAPASISLGTISRSGNNVTLNWAPTPAGSFTYTVQRKTDLLDPTWTTLVTGLSAATYTDTTASADKGFYRVSSP
jgi:hypothetical protein